MGSSRGTTQDRLWVCSEDDKKKPTSVLTAGQRKNLELQSGSYMSSQRRTTTTSITSTTTAPQKAERKNLYMFPRGRAKEPLIVPADGQPNNRKKTYSPRGTHKEPL